MARTPGALGKFPTRKKVHDALLEQGFDVLGEIVDLYQDAPSDVQLDLLKMCMEYCFPKCRPVDNDGNPENPLGISVQLTNEQLLMLSEKARGGK